MGCVMYSNCVRLFTGWPSVIWRSRSHWKVSFVYVCCMRCNYAPMQVVKALFDGSCTVRTVLLVMAYNGSGRQTDLVSGHLTHLTLLLSWSRLIVVMLIWLTWVNRRTVYPTSFGWRRCNRFALIQHINAAFVVCATSCNTNETQVRRVQWPRIPVIIITILMMCSPLRRSLPPIGKADLTGVSQIPTSVLKTQLIPSCRPWAILVCSAFMAMCQRAQVLQMQQVQAQISHLHSRRSRQLDITHNSQRSGNADWKRVLLYREFLDYSDLSIWRYELH